MAPLAFLLALLLTAPTASAPTPSQQLFMLKEVRPDVSKIGVIWDGDLNDATLERARRAAVAHGVELLLARVEGTRDVAPAFRELVRAQSVDALWILTDGGLMSREPSRGFLLRESTLARVPVLSPGEAWVRDGACLAVVEGADGIRLVINRPVAEALALRIPDQYADVTDFLASK